MSGHSFCWDPSNCMSCGCSWNGPCYAHHGVALQRGWDGRRTTYRTPEDADGRTGTTRLREKIEQLQMPAWRDRPSYVFGWTTAIDAVLTLLEREDRP